jgi:hypothetical protein
MSQVVCFRLDRQNQREALALAVLSAWQEAGYSTRHILTEALLGLDDGSQDELSAVIAELREVVGHAHDLLEEMRDGRHVPPPRAGDGQAAHCRSRSSPRSGKPPGLEPGGLFYPTSQRGWRGTSTFAERLRRLRPERTFPRGVQDIAKRDNAECCTI